MTAWTSHELTKVGTADELEISGLRPHGTMRNPVTIWVVRLGDDLYVRSVNGPTGAWFRGARERGRGRISAGGVERDVAFVDPDHDIDDELDAAYREKYRRYGGSPVEAITSPGARSTTIKLEPVEGTEKA